MKALAPIAGRPWARHALAMLREAFPAADLFVNVNRDQQERAAGELADAGIRLHVEVERAGVGWALRDFSATLAAPSPLLAVLGDIIFDRAFPAWLAAQASRPDPAGAAPAAGQA